MSTLILSTFAQYEQTLQEQLTGQTLTQTQKEFIQNEICKTAELRIALVPDPINYAAFIQQEAYYKGQMDTLKYLLDCSTAAESHVLELAAQQAAAQNQ